MKTSKKALPAAIALTLAALFGGGAASGAEVSFQENLIVYFYSTTCAACGGVSDYLDAIGQAPKDDFAGLGLQGCSECAAVLEYIESRGEFAVYDIRKVNIGEPEGDALFKAYARYYGLPAGEEDVIPAVFFGGEHAAGEKAVKAALSAIGQTAFATPVLAADASLALEKFNALKILPVFAAGLVGGLNPCGLSMLLLFLAALMDGGKKFIAAGLVYCAARFITYFALGTLLYGALARVNFAAAGKVGVLLAVAAMLALAVANAVDYAHIKGGRYAKIRVQLPKKVKDLNQRLIRGLVKNNAKLILAVSFALGVAISFGEFLCTGQIYLGTIVTALNAYKEARPPALLLFGVYNAAMAAAPVCALLVIGKTYSVFNVAGYIQERLPRIKLLNAAAYVLFAAVLFAVSFR